MIARSPVLEQSNWARLRAVAESCAAGAAEDISRVLGRRIRIDASRVSILGVGQVPVLLGRPEETAVVVYLSTSGGVQGCMMVLFPVVEARALVDMMRNQKPASTEALDTLERSALGEVAKLTGLVLSKALAEGEQVQVRLSPPAVMVVPGSDILDVPLPEPIRSFQQALVVDILFSDDQRQVKAVLVVVPEMPSLTAILEVLQRRWQNR